MLLFLQQDNGFWRILKFIARMKTVKTNLGQGIEAGADFGIKTNPDAAKQGITLRLEMGYCLMEIDIDDTTSSF